MTDWKSVKLLTFHSMIGELVSPSVNYVGIILIPSLNVELPLANYTNDKVYTFGAGMLKPEKISSNKLLVIGAHNLGWKGTSALFTPLAFHRLKGREVFITNFQVVKEYRITSKQIISPFDVQAPFRGKNSLSLLTCTSDNKKRILVRARLVNITSTKRLNPKFKKSINKYRANMTD